MLRPILRAVAAITFFAVLLVGVFTLAAHSGGPATQVAEATLPTPTPTPVWSYTLTVTNDTSAATNHLSVEFKHGSVRVLTLPPGCYNVDAWQASDPYPGDVLVHSDFWLNWDLFTNSPCFDPGEQMTFENYSHSEVPSFPNPEPFAIINCADRDREGLCDVDEPANGTSQESPDSDGDGKIDVPWTLHYYQPGSTPADNCPSVANADQTNFDGAPADVPPKVSDDVTRERSDALGGACDDDDDNDGLADAAEADGSACAGATTNPQNRDSDGDLFIDAAECAANTDPNAVASRPDLAACGPASDADSDGIVDRRENCNYGTDPTATDSDVDGCSDRLEIASVNADFRVNSIDLSQIAQSFATYTLPASAVNATFDINKDGKISSIDLAQIAQSFASC